MAQGLRSLCTENGTLLCFDEVMTGFRIAKGCAQAHFGIMPDLTTVCFPSAVPYLRKAMSGTPPYIKAAFFKVFLEEQFVRSTSNLTVGVFIPCSR